MGHMKLIIYMLHIKIKRLINNSWHRSSKHKPLSKIYAIPT